MVTHNPPPGRKNSECAALMAELLLKSERLKKYRETELFSHVSQFLEGFGSEEPVRDLRIREVAERLRVSPSYARKLCDTGELTSYKVGNQRRVRESDIALYLEKREKRTLGLLQDLVDEAQESDAY